MPRSSIISTLIICNMGDMRTTQLGCLSTFGELGIDVCLLCTLPGGVGGFPAEENNPLEVFDRVVLYTDEAERVDHAVAHGDALDNVERHQGVLLAGDECGVEIAQDGVAVVRSPAEDVRR